MIRIQTDFASPTTANTQVLIDVRNEKFGNLQMVAPLPSGFLAERWYLGWWGSGNFEWRLDNAGAPAWESEILTAVRTRIGPELLATGLSNPHYGRPCIWRWYKQRGRYIRTRGYSEIFLNATSRINDQPVPWDLVSRPETIATDGPALLIPRDVTDLVYVRGEAMRKPGTTIALRAADGSETSGFGLAQITFCEYPLPAWNVSGHPNFGLDAKGTGSEQPPGHLESSHNLPIYYTPGTGKLNAITAPDTLGSMQIVGFEILPYTTYVPPAGNDANTVLFANKTGLSYTDTSFGGTGSPHSIGAFNPAWIASDHADFNLSGDFTIEVVCSATSFASQMTPASQWASAEGVNRAWLFTVLSNGSVSLQMRSGNDANGYTITSGSGVFSLNTQQTLTAIRSGSTLTLKVNGSVVGTATVSGALNDSARAVMIGGAFANGGGSVIQAWNGSVDRLAISNIAR